MGFVRVSPELGLIFDPLKGVVSEQRADVVLFTFDPVYERIEKLDKIADDLVNQLVPDNELLSSYAGGFLRLAAVDILHQSGDV